MNKPCKHRRVTETKERSVPASSSPRLSKSALLQENQELRARLVEAEETVRVIRSAEVDARKAAESALRKASEELENRVQEQTASLQESEERVRRKLESVLSPEADLGPLELADLVDTPGLQKLMDDFYAIAQTPLAILDAKGRVLVGVGWQQVCTQFHRVHPEACQHCLESDLQLSAGLKQGESRLYKCKNNMWDMATPIIVAGQHLGNVFTGQFFFQDEVLNRDLFRAQARRYGFDEAEYLAALERAPRLSRQTVQRGMNFLVKLAGTVSQLGYTNLKLARMVAERDRLTESMRQQQILIQTVIDNCTDPIFLKDRQSRFLLANPATCAAIGKPAARIIGKTDLEIYDDPAIGRQMMDNDRRIMASGQSQVVEELVSHPDGPRTFLSAKTPYRDAEGRVIGVIGIARDITERKKAEEALRRAGQELRVQSVALQSAANAISITDREGAIEWVNPAFERLTGYLAAELRGQNHRLLKSDRQEAAFYKELWDTITAGRVWHGEVVNKRKDGSLYDEEMTITPVRDSQGGTTHFIAIKQDISERKRAEEALRLARDELERKVQERTAQLVEANANLQAFAYTAAHDLRAPLRSIRSFSALLAEDCAVKLGPDDQSLLGRVVGSADQMDRLLNDLLEYSKMSQAEVKLEPVDLGKAAGEALALLDTDIRGKNAAVTVGEALPEVMGHAATVVLVINNLVSNALKFIPPGVQPQIRISAERTESCVRLAVQDNGIGIAPGDLGKIFGAFQRLHGKQTYPGTGLGLAIVRKGAERMGGRVGVDSEVGKGSRFWVELKAANQSASG